MKKSSFFISSYPVSKEKLEEIAEKINQIASTRQSIILRAIKGFQSPHDAIDYCEKLRKITSSVDLKDCFLSQIDEQEICKDFPPVFIEDSQIILCAGRDQRVAKIGDVISIPSEPIDDRWHVIVRPRNSASFYFWTFVKEKE